MNITVFVEGKKVKIPQRVYLKWYLPLCKPVVLRHNSRHHNGHVREAALKKLLALHVSTKDVPYIFLALADYVIEVSSMPLSSNAQTKQALAIFAHENKELFKLVEAETISYWNEYYRGKKYPAYTDYPSYAYLQTLKKIKPRLKYFQLFEKDTCKPTDKPDYDDEEWIAEGEFRVEGLGDVYPFIACSPGFIKKYPDEFNDLSFSPIIVDDCDANTIKKLIDDRVLAIGEEVTFDELVAQLRAFSDTQYDALPSNGRC